MAQVVREAVAVYLADGPSSGVLADDHAYLEDPAWRLFETAEQIGGSGEPADASRLEEELYGPIQT